MIVSIKDFTSALNKVSALVARDKNPMGVYINIGDTSVRVAYHDGRKAVFEDVDASIEDGDVHEPIVMNYTRLCSIVDACQPSGMIITDTMSFNFVDGKMIKVRAEKKIAIITSEETEEAEERTCSVFEQAINYELIDANLRTALLGRIDYSNICNCETYSLVNLAGFRGMMGKCSVEQGTTVYVSPKNGIAFVANKYSVTCIKLEEEFSNNIIMSSMNSNILVDVLGKTGETDIAVCSSNANYINVFNENKTFGLWLEQSKPSQTNLTMLGRYRDKKYRYLQFTLVKEVFANVIKAATSSDKLESAVFELRESGEFCGVEIAFKSSNSSASIANEYSIACSSYYGECEDIHKVKIPMSLRVLENILANCDEAYIGFDIGIFEDGSMYVRISDIDQEKKAELAYDEAQKIGLTYAADIPKEKEADVREEAMKAVHYTVSNKG